MQKQTAGFIVAAALLGAMATPCAAQAAATTGGTRSHGVGFCIHSVAVDPAQIGANNFGEEASGTATSVGDTLTVTFTSATCANGQPGAFPPPFQVTMTATGHGHIDWGGVIFSRVGTR